MSDLPNCPQCNSEYTYEDGVMFVCPECGHEWSKDAADNVSDEDVIKDANGNVLTDGDTITVIKDLKVKGSSLVVKVGTKVKNIRLVGGDHDIDCKIDGVGAMKLKSEFVKKVQFALIVLFYRVNSAGYFVNTLFRGDGLRQIGCGAIIRLTPLLAIGFIARELMKNNEN